MSDTDVTLEHRASMLADSIYRYPLQIAGALYGAAGWTLDQGADIVGLDGDVGYNGDFEHYGGIQTNMTRFESALDSYYDVTEREAPQRQDWVDDLLIGTGEAISSVGMGGFAAKGLSMASRTSAMAAESFSGFFHTTFKSAGAIETPMVLPAVPHIANYAWSKAKAGASFAKTQVFGEDNSDMIEAFNSQGSLMEKLADRTVPYVMQEQSTEKMKLCAATHFKTAVVSAGLPAEFDTPKKVEAFTTAFTAQAEADYSKLAACGVSDEADREAITDLTTATLENYLENRLGG